jgi:RNA 3'-terminal phosphate cyclase (ATP)
MISIDGSSGEGGGQILRTSLSLSLVTGQPFQIANIRAGRERPGLLRQHLAAVLAAARIGEAEVDGAFLGSTALTFAPATVRPGKYHFAVGTAGSATLVLQTILPALMVGSSPSEIIIEGGTHNMAAPPFDFLARTFLPLIEKMGPKFQASLERYGFYPAGGGRFVIDIQPCAVLSPIEIEQRGHTSKPKVNAIVANLPRHIAQREVDAVAAALGCGLEQLRITETKNASGPGNVVMVEVETAAVTEVFTSFGKMGLSAEKVAADVAAQAQAYLASGAAVCEHLADQLLLPMAMAGGGSFTTVTASSHARTNMDVIAKFLPTEFTTEGSGNYKRISVERSRTGP